MPLIYHYVDLPLSTAALQRTFIDLVSILMTCIGSSAEQYPIACPQYPKLLSQYHIYDPGSQMGGPV